MRIWNLLHKLLLGLILVGFPLPIVAAETYDENQLKAAITYNVAKFVKWPDGTFVDAKAPLVICVIGNDRVAAGFESLEGQFLGERPIKIYYLASMDDYQGGHILYVTHSKDYHVDEILTVLQDSPVLTVSDIESFARRGGMVSLLKMRKNIRFAINLDASLSVDLKISSKLHALATEVIRNGD